MQESYAQQYALLERDHWWFRARRLILRDFLARLKWPPQPKLLEVGVGPGYNLLEIYASDVGLEGAEPDPILAGLAASRGLATLFNTSFDRMTYFNTFLFLPIAVVRLISRFSRQAYKAEGDFAHVRRPSNALLFTLFGAERFALRYLHFPFGVSIFAVARKEYIE